MDHLDPVNSSPETSPYTCAPDRLQDRVRCWVCWWAYLQRFPPAPSPQNPPNSSSSVVLWLHKWELRGSLHLQDFSPARVSQNEAEGLGATSINWEQYDLQSWQNESRYLSKAHAKWCHIYMLICIKWGHKTFTWCRHSTTIYTFINSSVGIL